ncbi:MAG: glycoside hydrolase family 104 protein [Alphaproteobacteria bacterium]|nr:glycoside hydrolase family 104 protein [Alphaproteobacteria bacterium]
MTNYPRSPRYSEYEAALQHPNVRAFLDAIAKAEGTYRRGDDGYNIVVGHSQFNNGYAEHPRRMVQLNPRLRSNAAGRYQFISTTWDRIARTYGYNDFKPHTQDIAAVSLIAERGALQAVMRGDIQRAAHLCRQEWASLPGSEHGQRTVSVNSFLKGFRDALAEIGRGINNVFTSIGSAIGNAFRPPAPQQHPLPQVQQHTQPQGWVMHRHNGDQQPTPSAIPLPTPSAIPSATPSYSPQMTAPLSDMRPELRHAPSTTPMVPWVNNRAPVIPNQQTNVIMGDSIGVGVGPQYPGVRNVAEGGRSIGVAANQFARVPRGSVADVYLGTNNAPYTAEQNRQQVLKFLAAADRQGVRINNWILPAHHERSRATDAGLQRVGDIITQTIREYNAAHPDRPPIQTVATRDRGVVQSADGYHFTDRGNQQLRTLVAQQVQTLIANTARPPAVVTTTTTTTAWAMQRHTPPHTSA